VEGVLSLKVTPRITPDGGIVLAVEITKNTIISRSPVEISVKSVKTEILVENGGTVVIGGIFELTETESETKVPLLGDLPGVGNLFKTRNRSSEKQEMLVFLTPRVVADKAVR
jgi:type IV pilus assembly protein PilQ